MTEVQVVELAAKANVNLMLEVPVSVVGFVGVGSVDETGVEA